MSLKPSQGEVKNLQKPMLSIYLIFFLTDYIGGGLASFTPSWFLYISFSSVYV